MPPGPLSRTTAEQLNSVLRELCVLLGGFSAAAPLSVRQDQSGVSYSLNGNAIDILTQMSITQDSSGLKLVNDATSPAAFYCYGTDVGGTKGWLQKGLNVADTSGVGTVSNAVSITFDQTTGFDVTTLTTYGAEVAMLSASPTQIGVMSTTTQSFAGEKSFNDGVRVRQGSGSFFVGFESATGNKLATVAGFPTGAAGANNELLLRALNDAGATIGQAYIDDGGFVLGTTALSHVYKIIIGATTFSGVTGTSGGGDTVKGGIITTLGTASAAVTVANESSDTTCFPAFFTAATGNLGPKTNTNLTFDSSTGLLSALVPTASVNTNTTQVASTAFVVGQAGASTPAANSGAGVVGTSLRYSRDDHAHPAISPGDLPGVQTYTLGGTITALPGVPTWYSTTCAFGDFSVAANTRQIALVTVPAGTIVWGVKVKASTLFSGGAIASYNLSVGTTSNATQFSAAYDVHTTPVGAAIYQLTAPTGLSNTTGAPSHTGTTALQIQAGDAGALLNAATAGAATVWLLLSACP